MSTEKKLPEGMWKRGQTYWARFSSNGRVVRKPLSRDRDTAEILLTQLKARTEKGDYGLLDLNFPYAELRKLFLAWVRQSLRRPGEYERHLDNVERFRKIANVREIDHAFVIAYRDWRLTTPLPLKPGQKKPNKLAGPRTVNLEVQTLHNMLSKAADPRSWNKIGRNPIEGIEPLKVDRPRKKRRALTYDEVLRLFEHSPDYLKPVWRFYAVTGVRRDELVELLFSDIDFRQNTVTIRPEIAKDGEERMIPLDDETMGMIRKLKSKAASKHVFTSTVGTPLRNNLLTRFYTVCKRAGIEGGHRGGSVDIHSLRGTFISLAIENGASPKDVQEIVGHATLNMTMNTYAKVNVGSKRKAIAALPFVNDPGRTKRAQVI